MALTILKPEITGTPVKGVLFDMDGILLDTEKLYCRFWQEAAIACGYPMTREQALGMRSLNRTAGQQQLERYFGPEVDIHVIREQRIALMDAYTDAYGVELKPGVKEVLSAIREKGIRCAITTSSPIERVKRHMAPHGILSCFDCICTGYDVARGKPAPDIYLKGARMLGLRPENCLAVEDSPAGLLSANRAGCQVVLIPDQDPVTDDTRPLLYAMGDSLEDLIPLLI